jgi:hypothetical protein
MSYYYRDMDNKCLFLRNRRDVVKARDEDFESGEKQIIDLPMDLLDANNVLSYLYRLVPMIYKSLNEEADGLEIVGIIVRPIKLKKSVKKKGYNMNSRKKIGVKVI